MRLSLKPWLGARWPEQRFVLAVSGGVDSMVMLDLYAAALPAKHLVVAHFDHGVRADSRVSAQLVRRVARERGLTFVLGEAEGGGRSEAELRRQRRAFLERLARETHSDFIVTAHHAQDQLETLLMRLIRGTGASGWVGIRPRNGIWLRPFLRYTKQEMVRYARRRKLDFHPDSTNDSPRYFRNRVRQQVVPSVLNSRENLEARRNLRVVWQLSAASNGIGQADAA